MSTHTIRELLASQPVLAGLEPGDLDLMAGCGRLEVMEPGAPLARGRSGGRFFVVRAGRVGLGCSPTGPLVVETLESGDIVGWSWIFPPHRWVYDVDVLERAHLVVIDASCLREKCDADPVRLSGHEALRPGRRRAPGRHPAPGSSTSMGAALRLTACCARSWTGTTIPGTDGPSRYRPRVGWSRPRTPSHRSRRGRRAHRGPAARSVLDAVCLRAGEVPISVSACPTSETEVPHDPCRGRDHALAPAAGRDGRGPRAVRCRLAGRGGGRP